MLFAVCRLLLYLPILALAGDAGPCEAGEECPSDFESLLQMKLEVQPKPPKPPVLPLREFPDAPVTTSISRRLSKYFRQQLYNDQDMQYSGDMKLGAEDLRAVMDTGSFELLVFSKSCTTCGAAAKYDYRNSENFVPGMLVTVHSFGSGTVKCLDGSDSMEIANITVKKQDFWEAVHADMPALSTASFNAIAGLGPPGQPQRSAQKNLAETPDSEFITKLVNEKDDSMLINLGVRYFSACFEWAVGAPGYLIWNDTPPKEQDVDFNEINVTDRSYWTARLSSPRLSVAAADASASTISLGCENSSCSALLDTGTSLIGVPNRTFHHALTALNNLNSDCTNLKDMPDLEFVLGSSTYRLPATAYIGIIEGYVAQSVGSLFQPIPKKGPIACQLLLMNSEGMGKDLWILGMPFFRYYYTTFDLGDDPYDFRTRRIWTAPAAANCTPMHILSLEEKLMMAKKEQPWRVNGTMIREPWALRRTKQRVPLPRSSVEVGDERERPRAATDRGGRDASIQLGALRARGF